MTDPAMLTDAEVAERLGWPELLAAVEDVLRDDRAGGRQAERCRHDGG